MRKQSGWALLSLSAAAALTAGLLELTAQPCRTQVTVTNHGHRAEQMLVQVTVTHNGQPYAEAPHATVTPETFTLGPGQSRIVTVHANGDTGLAVVPEIVNADGSVTLLAPSRI